MYTKMTHDIIQCDYCKKNFSKEKKKHNKLVPLYIEQFCSLRCDWYSKNKNKKISCKNPICQNTLVRSFSDFNKNCHFYCSQSCAAQVNNKITGEKLKKIRTCPVCDGQFKGSRKYCSWGCLRKHIVATNQTLSKDIIIQRIKDFYNLHQRIPIKQEFYNAKGARAHFGTWNKAIIAAGFIPNPVKFAKRFRARDGHICDSLSEMIIDNWLESNHIPHNIHIPYKVNNMSADFKVGDILIEFVGLEGKVAKYDQSLERGLYGKKKT